MTERVAKKGPPLGGAALFSAAIRPPAFSHFINCWNIDRRLCFERARL